ncbi:hypothetical protein NJC38_14190 [Pseudomonas sp. 21LCFQ010]|uniref:hypothetical protein n=1 Tax=Pseudomonas sp. 21LCFQ010 TaxID=2957506 RepID=UPI0020986012|nr:hypothetical protein [Pseudomonas sp. 21LCFQ010]MCO8163310.1 hypothetical protein [Pseudomonas sp. 21LCFQ010]
MTSKTELIAKINARTALSAKAAEDKAQRKNFFFAQARKFNTTLTKMLDDIPEIKITTFSTQAESDDPESTSWSITLFEQTIDLTPFERDGEYSLKADNLFDEQVFFTPEVSGLWVATKEDGQRITLNHETLFGRLYEFTTERPASKTIKLWD